MRHQKKRNKLSRDSGHRKALVRNLCAQVLTHERIKTTEAKAKVVKPEVERLITLAKRGGLHARRQALAELNQDKFIVHKLFDEIAPRYDARPGGYTRILKLGPRRSDSSEMVFIELGLSRPVRKLTLEYHGAAFAGWAAQPGLRTVEGVLGDALQTVLGERVDISVAGRTDTGVHALGQVASFSVPRDADPGRLEPERLLASLNGLLPADVAVRAAEQAPDGFDARRDARSRSYVYRLLARRAPSPLRARPRPVVAARRWTRRPWSPVPRLLPGAHDFTAFTPTRTDHVRFEREVLAAEWDRHGDLLEFGIEADAFMRHMVRVLVGTMLEVGSGRRTAEDFAALLQGAPRDRGRRDRAGARPAPGAPSRTRPSAP